MEELRMATAVQECPVKSWSARSNRDSPSMPRRTISRRLGEIEKFRSLLHASNEHRNSELDPWENAGARGG